MALKKHNTHNPRRIRAIRISAPPLRTIPKLADGVASNISLYMRGYTILYLNNKPEGKARLADFGAERGIRGTRNPRLEARKLRGLCADSVSSLLGSQLCAIPRHPAPYGARICASGRGFRRGLERGFFFVNARLLRGLTVT